MPKFRITAETAIVITADSEEEALEQFYDEVYEVDRHGRTRVEVVES
jgi:hypothetical protein